MKKLLFVALAVLLAASCGGKTIELDKTQNGDYYSFSYPGTWKLTSRDAETRLESESSTIIFRFAKLEASRQEDIQSIQELVDNYVKTATTNGSVSKNEVIDLGGHKAAWVESSAAAISTVTFFLPENGGVFIGETQNITDSDVFEAAKSCFLSFKFFKTPEIESTDSSEELVTHNGVIYSISFPKSWKISGDNPMTIAGNTGKIEISVAPDSGSKALNLSSINKARHPETLVGNTKALETSAPDKSWVMYSIPLASKVMGIKVVGAITPQVEACLKSFKYFPEKDITDPKSKPQDNGTTTNQNGKTVKPADDLSVPNPNSTQTPTGDTHSNNYYAVILPKSWTAETQTPSIESIYPPDKDCNTYIDISVQPYMDMSALEVAKLQIEVIEGAKPEITTLDIAGTKAAQFTYDAGHGPTVNTIITKGSYQFTITYFQGKKDYRNEYAAILKTFEPK